MGYNTVQRTRELRIKLKQIKNKSTRCGRFDYIFAASSTANTKVRMLWLDRLFVIIASDPMRIIGIQQYFYIGMCVCSFLNKGFGFNNDNYSISMFNNIFKEVLSPSAKSSAPLMHSLFPP